MAAGLEPTAGTAKYHMKTISTRAEGNNEVLESALALADLGWPVPSVRSAEKKPLIKSWRHRATTQPEVIEAWSTEFDHPDFGILTGRPSGVLVLDVDGCGRRSLSGLPGRELRVVPDAGQLR